MEDPDDLPPAEKTPEGDSLGRTLGETLGGAVWIFAFVAGIAIVIFLLLRWLT